MDCVEVRQRLTAGGWLPDPSVDEHLAKCEECVALGLEQTGAPLREDGTEAGTVRVEPLLEGLGRRLAAERGVGGWLRSLPTWQRRLFGALVAIGIPLLFATARPRVDLAVYPETRLIALVLLLLGLGAVSLWVKFRPLYRPQFSRHVRVLLAIASLGVMAIGAALPAAHSLHPASLRGTGADFLPEALKCMSAGLLIGLPAFLLTAMLDRSNDDWRDASVLGAVVAGLAGYLALHLHCPIVAPVHLLAGHLTVLVVFLVAYSVLGSKDHALGA